MQVGAGVKNPHTERTRTSLMNAPKEDYVRRRLSDLQVSLDLVDTDIFRMKNRGGFTRQVNSTV